VTANLHTALRQFRRCRSTETQLLWVDQICINQEDLLERSDQVQLMYTIYSRADTVYISLGEGEEGQAIELM
jgi:hypothetical protein